jgi:hypothetical protein
MLQRGKIQEKKHEARKHISHQRKEKRNTMVNQKIAIDKEIFFFYIKSIYSPYMDFLELKHKRIAIVADWLIDF